MTPQAPLRRALREPGLLRQERERRLAPPQVSWLQLSRERRGAGGSKTCLAPHAVLSGGGLGGSARGAAGRGVSDIVPCAPGVIVGASLARSAAVGGGTLADSGTGTPASTETGLLDWALACPASVKTSASAVPARTLSS